MLKTGTYFKHFQTIGILKRNFRKIFCQHDEREEAKQFDIYMVSVYKKQGQEKALVGHAPIEFSFLSYKFIEKDGNKIYAKVRGGRQLENGLVVPATYIVCGKNKRLIQILLDEAQKRKRAKLLIWT